jgi:hypothetical protein
MIVVFYESPDSPHAPCNLMFGAELKRAHNRGKVFCGTCNTEIKSIDPCALTAYRLYCWTCAQEYILPRVKTVF